MRRIIRNIKRSNILLQGLIILILTLVIFFAAYYQPGKSCTIFTAVQDDLVLYGNSEDQHNSDPVLGFFPPSSEGYGSVHFGITNPDGSINFEGAVNDQGLAWDCNSTPKTRIDPDPNPGKPYFLDSPNYLYQITKRAATVDEAIRIARTFHFGESMIGQYHIADASGDAVVISGGPDGKIAFTRIEPSEGYLLSTNFNLAQPERGPVDFRWYTATEKLEALATGANLTPEYAMDLMEAVHLETLTTFTLYQNVVDLNERKIFLTYMSQYNEMAVIDMQEEFNQGQRVVQMRDFFSADTAAAGDAAYASFALRFKAAVAGVITVASGLLLGVVFVFIKKIKRSRS